MRAGSLKHRVTIQQRADTRNDAGEVIAEWQDVVTVWGQIETASARGVLLYKGSASQVSHTLRIRYREGINSEQRVKFGSRFFDIEGIINTDQENRELQLFCNELEGVSS